MTGQAILIRHFSGMRVVTLETTQELTMLEVALLAIEFGVFAGVVCQLGSLSGMTGETDRLDR